MKKSLFFLFFGYLSLCAQKGTLLEQSDYLISSYSGKKIAWRDAYAIPRAEEVLEKGSIWLVPKKKEKGEYFSSLYSLFPLLQEIGIQSVDLGQIFSSNLPHSLPFPSSAPISMEINPELGSLDELLSYLNQAERENIQTVTTAQIGATGWGKDFFLALRFLSPYQGIYHMIEIEKEDWVDLPEIPHGQLVHTLSRREIETLVDKEYIVGLFSSLCGKKVDVLWNVTGIVQGVDGKERRWVYLSYLSPMQPCMNWTDPSFTSQRIFSGTLLFLTKHLHSKLIHIDANPFLGIEKGEGRAAWSESHPLTLTAVETMAQMARKYGSSSALDIEMELVDLASFFAYGPEFIYDKSTSRSFLQSLSHKNSKEIYQYLDQIIDLSIPLHRVIHPLFEKRRKMFFSSSCCNQPATKKTLLEVIADLNTTDLYHLTDQDKEKLTRSYFLYAFFYLMQPGIVTLSMDELQGSYYLSECESGKCRKCSLFGSCQKQLKDKESFLSQLKQVIKARKIHHIESARLIKTVQTPDPSLLIYFLAIPPSNDIVMIAFNFSSCPKQTKVSSRDFVQSWAINIIERKNEKKDLFSSDFHLELPPNSAKAIHFQPKFE